MTQPSAEKNDLFRLPGQSPESSVAPDIDQETVRIMELLREHGHPVEKPEDIPERMGEIVELMLFFGKNLEAFRKEIGVKSDYDLAA